MQAAFYTDFLLMDVRREPRFSISGPIKVTLLSSPERDLDPVLLDISATGLKLIAPESLAVDEIVSIAAEDHLALADVRYSQPRGDKFTIGCERIHLLNKVSLPNEKPKIEQIQLLIEDYRNRIRTGIATERPDTNQVEAARLDVLPPPEKPPAAEQTLPNSGSFATREQLLDAAAVWILEHRKKSRPRRLRGPLAEARSWIV
jgi:hypothetical protein